MFLKESFFIAGNGNPEKVLYISGNGTFLYLGKLLIFQQQEITFRARKGKKNSHLDFRKRNFLATSLKNPFFYGNPLEFFITFFSGVFIFYHRLLPLFFGVFYFWFHFLMSPVLQLLCQVLHFCVVVPRVLRIWQGFFNPKRFLPYTPSPCLPQ